MRHFSAFSTILAAVASFLVAPLFATAFFRAYEPEYLPFYTRKLTEELPLLFDFSAPIWDYQVYGRIYALFIPLTFPALLALGREYNTRTGLSRWAWRTLILGVLLFGLGIIVEYWNDPDSRWVGAGFALELVGLLLTWVGGIMSGFMTLRATHIPRWVGRLLAIIAPGGIIGMILLGHIPSGPLLGYMIFSLFTGFHLISGERSGRFETWPQSEVE